MRKPHLVWMILLLFVGLAAGWHLGRGGSGVVHAQDFQEYYVGRDWGPLRATVGNRLIVFEADDGTIRIVDLLDHHPSTRMLKVQRTLTRK